MGRVVAPEQAAAQAADYKADLSSLSTLLHSLCTASASNSQVPAWLEEVIARLQAPDAKGGFASAAEVAEVLQQHLAPEHQSSPATASRPLSPKRQITSASSAVGAGHAAAAVLAAALLAGQHLLVPEKDEPHDPPTSLPVPDADTVGWVQLFNGKDLTGWKTHPISPAPGKSRTACWWAGTGRSYLYTLRNDYRDFHFRVKAKINARTATAACISA